MMETLQTAGRACTDVANWFLFAMFFAICVLGLAGFLARELDQRDRDGR